MGETGIVRFPGNLDPSAQEFRPRNPNNQAQLTLFRPPRQAVPHVYFPYTASDMQVQVQVVPFCEGTAGYGCQLAAASPAYVATPELRVQATVAAPSAAATRTLVLSAVPVDVSEETVRRELEGFGELRGLQMERIREGIVTVHFYDLRHAEEALRVILDQHMQHQTRLRNHYYTVSPATALPPLPPPAPGLIAGRTVWAQFGVPSRTSIVPDGLNQGTIVIFNLDSEVPKTALKEIFETFGEVKELRETPLKRQQRFVEFYDVRDAAKALREMNGKEIRGKPVVIEFSRPGGHSRKFFNAPTPGFSDNLYHTESRRYPTVVSPPIPPPPPLHRKFSGQLGPNVSPSHLSQTKLLTKKTSFSKGSPKNANLEANVASMSLGSEAVNGIEEKESSGPPKRNVKKSPSITSALVAKQQPRSGRPWKGRQTKKFDTRFLINEDAILESNCRDSRTTVMIKNIPNKYSQKLLLNMLDNHCIHCNEQVADGVDQPFSSYDFVYLPIDFNNKCNVGYGFVNMTTPQATWRLYKAFHLQHWEVFNSRKICEVTYARVQGLEALKEHFKNSKFPCEMDHYLPVVFSPPRDGRQLTEPLPLVGQNKQQRISIGLSGLKSDDMDGQDTGEDDGNDVRESDADQQNPGDVLFLGASSHTNCNSDPNGGQRDDDYTDTQDEET